LDQRQRSPRGADNHVWGVILEFQDLSLLVNSSIDSGYFQALYVLPESLELFGYLVSQLSGYAEN